MMTLRDFNLGSKRILVRCDFNVPLSKEGEILDDFRIRQTIPTIEYLKEKKGKIILISHLGRPEIKRDSSEVVAKRLEKLLGSQVKFLKDCIGDEIEKEVGKMREGEIVLLENLRFYKEEEEGNLEFAEKLAKLGDIFIQESFGALHRSHASIVGIPEFLPSGAGFLLEKEIKVLSDLMDDPKKPLIVIIGGKKVEDKAKMVDRISEKAEWILVGNLMQEEIRLKNMSFKDSEKIVYPVDSTEGRDIGPETIKIFREKIKEAQTVFWNGPLGQTEKKEFTKGSEEIARAIIESRAFSVAGGGETAEFLNKLNLAGKFNHVSTGGGALLKFLSGEKLPGLEVLK